MKTQTMYIGGMTCVNCQNRIEKKLSSTPGVEDVRVNFNTGTATVTYDPSAITFNEIKTLIETLDYQVLEDKAKTPVTEITGTLVIILSLYVLLQGLGIGAVTSAFPLAEAGMGYGMLFVIGLMTSVHCIAMCGGINLSQCLAGNRSIKAKDKDIMEGSPSLLPPIHLFTAPLLYNAGRVLSYTLIGALVGALGSVITLSGRFQGILQVIAGVFMVIMGINMLGIFPALRRFNLSMPNSFANKIAYQKSGNKNPLIIGLLNGLMPCGPLQAMQLYALSTGSPIAGGISMFLFSMGTVPLMFGIGAVSSLLSKRFTARALKIGAILVTVMGMTMFTYGFSLSGFSFNGFERLSAAINPFSDQTVGSAGETFAPVIEKGVQIVSSTLSAGRYPAITVQQGIPVKWTINAPQGSINGCNNRMIIREYGIEYRFKLGENVIEFTPTKIGKFSYSCWMGMIRSSITVVADGAGIADMEQEPDTAPQPAGIQIPTDTIGVAQIQGGMQEVTVSLTDAGFEPSIMVVERYVPVRWIINNDSLDPGNRGLIVPAYYAQVPIEQGNNVIQFRPEGDFDFSTIDNVFYGYVKVVEDVTTIDIESIKTEVSHFETLIYPDAYFDEASRGGGCCGGGA